MRTGKEIEKAIEMKFDKIMDNYDKMLKIINNIRRIKRRERKYIEQRLLIIDEKKLVKKTSSRI